MFQSSTCSVQFSTVTQSCLTLCDPMDCSTPGPPVHHQRPEFAQIHVHQVSESVMPSNHLILCRPLLLLPSIFPRLRVFSNVSAPRIRWPKYWSFSFSLSSSNEYSRLISFMIDVGSPCSPRDSKESSPTPQFKSINSLALSFLYGPTLTSYMTTGKTIALTRWTFVGRVMSLLFNMLSMFVIAFLLRRSKHLLISCVQSPSAVILEPKKMKSVTVASFSIYLP